MAWDDSEFTYDPSMYEDVPMDNSYMTDFSSYLDPGYLDAFNIDNMLQGFDPSALQNFDLGSGLGYSPAGLDYSSLGMPMSQDLGQQMWSSPDLIGQSFGAGQLSSLDPAEIRQIGTPEAHRAADNLEQAQQQQEQELSQQFGLDQVQQDLSGMQGGMDWRKLLMPEYGSSNAAWAENPRGTDLLGKDLHTAQSYVDSQGNAVESPYDYVQGEDGSAYIRNLNTGRDIGYLDGNLQDQTYQDARIENNADQDLLTSMRGALGKLFGTGSANGGAQNSATRVAQTAAQANASGAAGTRQNESPAQAALKAAQAALMMYQAVAGKNKQQVKKRDSSVANTGPQQNATVNRRTLYAKGGEIEGSYSDGDEARLLRLINDDSTGGQYFSGWDQYGTPKLMRDSARKNMRSAMENPSYSPEIERALLRRIGSMMGSQEGAIPSEKRLQFHQEARPYARGGEIEGLPQDVKGGLLPVALRMAQHMASRKGFVDGEAGGQDDVVDLKGAPGEYMIDADVVAALGDGNSKAGAAKLDQMRHNVRKHKRSGALSQIPPKAKSIDQYMKGK